MHEGYLAALATVDKIIQMHGLDDKRPELLHHYTSLEAGLNIIQQRDIRLSHCEYLNDPSEIHKALAIIEDRLYGFLRKTNLSRSQQKCYSDVKSRFDNNSRRYEAFVFSMSEGKPGINEQDNLSSWRAYGKDGRGVCLSFESQHFIAVSKSAQGFRLSRVIYDEQHQERIIDDVLDLGYAEYCRVNDPNEAINCIVAALIFFMPTFKHAAFAEEKEWRFVYLPDDEDPSNSTRNFHVRDDLIIPYYSLSRPSSDSSCQAPPVAEIMVGPSAHQMLNMRSLEFLRARATVKGSGIPYRR